jgi:lipopolysaccharide export LptBFGC system permease protein LptF
MQGRTQTLAPIAAPTANGCLARGATSTTTSITIPGSAEPAAAPGLRLRRPAHHLTRRLFTESARYIGDDSWIFSKGWARIFGASVRLRYEPFAQPRIVRYPETPAYFNSEIKPPDEMGYHELETYIEETTESGQPEPELLVSLYQKVAYPVISFVMALVALPFAFRLGRQGTLYGIGLSVILGFVFMAIYAFFTKIGEAGALPALVAVWSPGTVFGILSVYLFLGVRT